MLARTCFEAGWGFKNCQFLSRSEELATKKCSGSHSALCMCAESPSVKATDRGPYLVATRGKRGVRSWGHAHHCKHSWDSTLAPPGSHADQRRLPRTVSLGANTGVGLVVNPLPQLDDELLKLLDGSVILDNIS